MPPKAEGLDEVGEPSLIELLLSNHGSAMYRVAVFFLRDDAAARDVVSEVLLKLVEMHAGEETVLTTISLPYLLRMVRNEAIDHLRRAEARHIVSTGDEVTRALRETLPDEYDNTPEAIVIAMEERAWLDEAIGRLRPRHKEVLILYYFELLSYQAIAERFGISEDEAQGLGRAAREALRRFAALDPIRAAFRRLPMNQQTPLRPYLVQRSRLVDFAIATARDGGWRATELPAAREALGAMLGIYVSCYPSPPVAAGDSSVAFEKRLVAVVATEQRAKWHPPLACMLDLVAAYVTLVRQPLAEPAIARQLTLFQKAAFAGYFAGRSLDEVLTALDQTPLPGQKLGAVRARQRLREEWARTPKRVDRLLKEAFRP